jgi:hypothetical protein
MPNIYLNSCLEQRIQLVIKPKPVLIPKRLWIRLAAMFLVINEFPARITHKEE